MGGSLTLCGDALSMLRTLPSDSVDCVVTSPPYWGLRDYGCPAVVFGGDVLCSHDWRSLVKRAAHGRSDLTQSKNIHSATRYSSSSETCSKCGAWKGQLGLEPTIQLFIEHLTEREMELWPNWEQHPEEYADALWMRETLKAERDHEDNAG